MNLHPDLSLLPLVLQASIVVQGVLALLLLFSLWSWWRIFFKLFQLRRASADAGRFEDEFWKGGDLIEFYQRTSNSREGGLTPIFNAGFREYSKHRRQGSASTRSEMRRSPDA